MQYIEENKDFISKMIRFFIVSLIGLIINTVTLIISLDDIPRFFPIYSILLDLNLPERIWEFPALMIAILVTTTWNFVINKLWTFKEAETDKNIGLETSQYLIVGAIGAIENLLIFGVFTIFFFYDPVPASIIAFIISVFSNFVLNNYWTFADKNSGK